jgi:hypothetical protein
MGCVDVTYREKLSRAQAVTVLEPSQIAVELKITATAQVDAKLGKTRSDAILHTWRD